MFGIGFFELCIIAIVALVFIGPKKLPEFMRQAGKFFVQMRRMSNEVRSTFDTVVSEAEEEIRKEELENKKIHLVHPKQSQTSTSIEDNAQTLASTHQLPVNGQSKKPTFEDLSALNNEKIEDTKK